MDQLHGMRREYGDGAIDPSRLPPNPFHLFEDWFCRYLSVCQAEPNAMLLATVDSAGVPDARVVLLKGYSEHGFIFYTNYQSSKAQQLLSNPHAAVVFYWHEQARQVRVRGKVSKLSSHQSDAYFAKRPRLSQIAAMVSPQSAEIDSFESLSDEFDRHVQNLSEEAQLQRPPHWGGYVLDATEFEYWQGRDSRMHQRVRYQKTMDQWQQVLIAP